MSRAKSPRTGDNAPGADKVQRKKRAAALSREDKQRKPAAKAPARKPRKPAAQKRLYAPGPLIRDEAALSDGLAALQALDPEVISHMIGIGGAPPLRRREPGLEGLVWIVVSQQVSVASANAIAGRIRARFPQLDAACLLAATDDDLRGCGLSAPKMRTMRALAEAIASGQLDLDALALLPPHEAHDKLVEVKGIGPWTADIFLLFCLGHPDAWPAGDLALQEAARLALGLKKRPDAARLEKIGERWRPWRGVAARLLWAYYKGVKDRAGMAMTD